MSGLPRSYAASGRVLGTRRDPKPGLADQEVYPSRVVRWARASATGLCQLGEVEGGLVSVGEADDHAGGAADGLEVGVEWGQEQGVGLLHAADRRLGDGHAAGGVKLGRDSTRQYSSQLVN